MNNGWKKSYCQHCTHVQHRALSPVTYSRRNSWLFPGPEEVELCTWRYHTSMLPPAPCIITTQRSICSFIRDSPHLSECQSYSGIQPCFLRIRICHKRYLNGKIYLTQIKLMPIAEFKMNDGKVLSVFCIISFKDTCTAKEGKSAVLTELMKYLRLKIGWKGCSAQSSVLLRNPVTVDECKPPDCKREVLRFITEYHLLNMVSRTFSEIKIIFRRRIRRKTGIIISQMERKVAYFIRNIPIDFLIATVIRYKTVGL